MTGLSRKLVSCRKAEGWNAIDRLFNIVGDHGTYIVVETYRSIENSNVKSYQPEQLTITVKKLGISGWIQEER